MAGVCSQATLRSEAGVDSLRPSLGGRKDPIISIITVVFLLDDFDSVHHSLVKAKFVPTIPAPLAVDTLPAFVRSGAHPRAIITPTTKVSLIQ